MAPIAQKTKKKPGNLKFLKTNLGKTLNGLEYSSLYRKKPKKSEDICQFKLDNGLRVILYRVSVIDMVSVHLRVNTGSSFEGQFLGSGISHFLEHSMFLGSKQFPKEDQFSNLIQAYGGVDLNAFTGESFTCYHFSVLSQYLMPALGALYDFTFHPLLRKKNIEKERGTIVSEMDIYDDKAADWFYRIVFSQIFEGEPNELPIIGLRKLFHQVTSQDLKKYHHTTYLPENMSLCLVGKFDISKVKRCLNQTFALADPGPGADIKKKLEGLFPGGQRGHWTPSSWPNSIPAKKVSRSSKKPSLLQEMRITETSHHRVKFVRGILCWEGCDFFHTDNYTLDIVSHILASGRGSILNEILKEKLDWVEKISAFSLQTHPHSMGRFFIEFTLPQLGSHKQVRQVVSKVTEKILSVLRQIRRHLTETMLDGSRNTFLKSFVDEKEDFIDVASTLTHSLTYFGHLNYEEDYFNFINSLTREEAVTTMKKYLHPQPHLFLLLPEKTFQSGPVCPNSARIPSQALPEFEKSLKKNIPRYVWNETPAVKEKPSHNPRILSSQTLRPTHRMKLSNQGVLLHKKITGLPKVTLQLIFPGGSGMENNHTRRNGSFNLLSQMFFASNRTHSKKEIADALRHNGILYNSFSGENTLGMSFSFLKDRLPTLLIYLESILSNTHYREADFIKEKKDAIYALKKSKEDSFREAMQQFKKHFFGDSGHGLDPKGNEKTLPLITSKEVMSLKKEFIKGSYLTAHLCGDFHPTDLHRLGTSLEKLSVKKSSLSSPKSKDLRQPRHLSLEEKSPLPNLHYQGKSSLVYGHDIGGQAHFIMGYRVPALGQGNGAMKLVNHYLEGIGGALFKLRSYNFVKNGKDLGGRCYRLGCFMKASKHYGMMVFYASFRKEAADEHQWALEAFQKELEHLRRKPIDDKELERAKTSLLVEMKTQSIKYDHLSLHEGLLEAYGLGHDFGEKETSQLQTLTARDLREAVNQYLGRDNFLGFVMKPQVNPRVDKLQSR